MTVKATHTEHDTTCEGVLFVAFELSEKTWKFGFTTGVHTIYSSVLNSLDFFWCQFHAAEL